MTLTIKLEGSEIYVILRGGDKVYPHHQKFGVRVYAEKVENAEDVLEGLDKILKKSKIEITDIKDIKIDALNKNRYTSYRIIKSIEKVLKLNLF